MYVSNSHLFLFHAACSTAANIYMPDNSACINVITACEFVSVYGRLVIMFTATVVLQHCWTYVWFEYIKRSYLCL